ncbi:MAG: FHIPEP family type III secretion protein, partial [Pseudomonadota bacterium]
DEIHMEFAANLVASVMEEATGLDSRIVNMRNHIAQEYGLILPEIRLTDNVALPDGTYTIRIQGVEVARSEVEVGRMLMLLGDSAGAAPGGRDVSEPVYGAPARWIEPAEQEAAAVEGLSVVTPTEVIATHMLEVIKQNFARLFTRRTMRRLLDEFVSLSDAGRAEANRRIIDEFIPDKVPVDQLQAVLRLLLEERVSVRNLPLILEAVGEANGATQVPEALAEHVRHRLGFQITAELQEPDGTLPLIQLAPAWEELFQEHQLEGEGSVIDVALPPSEFNRLANAIAEKVADAGARGRYPAIVTTTRRRRFLHTVLSAKGIRNPVFSFDEIAHQSRPAMVGVA